MWSWPRPSNIGPGTWAPASAPILGLSLRGDTASEIGVRLGRAGRSFPADVVLAETVEHRSRNVGARERPHLGIEPSGRYGLGDRRPARPGRTLVPGGCGPGRDRRTSVPERGRPRAPPSWD